MYEICRIVGILSNRGTNRVEFLELPELKNVGSIATGNKLYDFM